MSSIAFGLPQALDTAATPTFSSVALTSPETVSGLALTDATMTKGESGVARTTWSKYSWTNAMVVALGASLTGDVKVCTLPAKTMVHRVLMRITSPGAVVATLTVAIGRTSAAYIDYIVASDAKAVANTIYGHAAAALGTNLTGYDVPSMTATTDVYAHFISTVSNLSACTGSTGDVYIQTSVLP